MSESRFAGYENESDFWMLDQGRWEVNSRRTLTSKRGQAALRELEAALLALPRKRLVRGTLSDGDDVCAMGSLGVKRAMDAGADWRDAVLALADEVCPAERPEWVRYCLGRTADSGRDTAEYGERLGMAYTLAWNIASLNDDTFGRLTPEARYEAVLKWVRVHIVRESNGGAV